MKNRSGTRFSAWRCGCAVVLTCTLFSFGLLLAAQETEYYPGKLRIEKARNLSPEERVVEARFAAYLEAHTEQAMARYRGKFGKEINTDNARELSSDYAPGGIEAEDPATVAARTKWSSAVFEPASAVAKELYSRALKQKTSPGGSKMVVFTAGGAGVGKTTVLRQSANFTRAVEMADFVYDTTLSSFRSAMERISRALDSGRTVNIIFVYRDPVDAFVGGLLPRAKKTGRILPVEAFLTTHLGAVQEIQKIRDANKNDSRVAIAIVDNRGALHQPMVSDFEFVKAMARKYSRDALRKSLLGALEIAHEKGKSGDPEGISEAVYLAVKGRAP